MQRKIERRRDLVCEYVHQYTEKMLSQAQPLIGLDTESIAHALHFDRSNVSKELNELHRSDQMIKMLGKPTLYLHRDSIVQQYPGVFVPTVVPKGKTLESLIVSDTSDSFPADTTFNSGLPERPTMGFDVQFGVHSSMREAFLRAKAAVAYPPHGLHMYIRGNSGAGKMQFVRKLHEYAIASGLLRKDAPLIICDCRDFGNSFQLLLSRIFGYAKETGASSTKSRRGMVEKAAGGILCLKEVSCLPVQVQNHLCSLLETNTFSRIGESSVVRACNTLIIAVSTEAPSAQRVGKLCETIPVHIAIPDLNDRTLNEIFEYITVLFQRESAIAGVAFNVSKNTLSALLCATYKGNIAELRRIIQSTCAAAYLDYVSHARHASVSVQTAHLPPELFADIQLDIGMQSHAEAFLQLWPDDYIMFSPQMHTQPTSILAQLPPPSPAKAAAASHPIPMVIAVYGKDIGQQIAKLVCDANKAQLAWGLSFQPEDTVESLLNELEKLLNSLDARRGVLLATDILPLEGLCLDLQEKTGIEIQLLHDLRLPTLQAMAEQALSFAGTAKELYVSIGSSRKTADEGESASFFKRIITEALAPSLTFLNPEKASVILMETLEHILNDLDIPYSSEIGIKFIFHCSHMLERLISGNAFKYERLKSFTNEHGEVYICVEKRMRYPAEVFGVTIPATEIAYVAELFVQMAPHGSSR